MTLISRLKRLIAVASLALASIGLGMQTAAAEGVLEAVQKRGTLRVGMSTFVPWAMRDTTGSLIGFEIDVATKVAEDMGVEIEFVPTAWSGIIPALIAKKFDVIIGGMSITPQRNLTVNFTIPYAHSGQQMAANRALAGEFSHPRGLQLLRCDHLLPPRCDALQCGAETLPQSGGTPFRRRCPGFSGSGQRQCACDDFQCTQTALLV